MTKPQTPPDPYQVVIPDHVMEHLKTLPPEAVDDFAKTIALIREGPEAMLEQEGASVRPVLPHPVDYDRFTGRVYVPATRSISYLRGSVADISPPTVAVFDQELAEDVHGGTTEIRLQALRSFLLRWIEYIAVFGDPDTGRALAQAPDPETYGAVFSQAMNRVLREEFPDTADDTLAIRTFTDGERWHALCPITMIRVFRKTQEEAELALRMALLELITGY